MPPSKVARARKGRRGRPRPVRRSGSKAARARRRARPGGTASRSRSGFVGRSSSPVLDRYPPKDPSTLVRGPPPVPGVAPERSNPPPTAEPPAAPAGGGVAPLPEGLASSSLIVLDAGFDLEAFSKQLGETAIRVIVPRESLLEVLTRISEFMAFGIYVYAIDIRPAPAETLKSFEVELRRVDYSRAEGAWRPFREQGRADSPFGPSGGQSPSS